MDYKRLNFTGSDLMRFQNDINLSDNEKFIILCTQFLEYQSTEPFYFQVLYQIGALCFKLPDAMIRSLEQRVLQEKSHVREVIFEATVDKEIHNKYQTWKNHLTNREKYIIWSFCLNEIKNALGSETIDNFEYQVQQILNINRSTHNEIHKDINKLNYLCSNILIAFRK